MTLPRLIRARPFLSRPIVAGVLFLALTLVGVIPSALGAPKRGHQGPPVVTGSGIAIVPSETDPQIKSFNSPHFNRVSSEATSAMLAKRRESGSDRFVAQASSLLP